ncbi:MAG: DNA polymerase III subunit gamma/tau [Synergistaceae bacterium]|nr:DNA polymerase III subunit gamma/tau [Synergistaceae bacterium]
MGISLYRRYRPQKFSEVAGQSAAVDVLVRSLQRARTGQAYLFSGPRGCGKTTVARLLARALNCLAPVEGYEPCCSCKNCLAIAAGESLDVIEIDGASNNGVEEIRELRSHILSVPMSSKYKVYIIDEVHMLSISAFNALLKTLEEPPEHVVFILATTEAHKVPVTIRSRCQHIPFHRIETRIICERLIQVCEAESVKFQPEALWEIARQADGAMRDGLSMLEQVAGSEEETLTLADVETALGQASRSSLERWLESWRKGDMSTFCELDRMLAGGASPQRFLEELFSLVRNLWLVARWGGILETLDASGQEKEYLKAEAPRWRPQELERIMRFLAGLLPQTRMGLRMDVLSGLLMAGISSPEVGAPEKTLPSLTASPTRRPVVPDIPAPEPGSARTTAPKPAVPEPVVSAPAAAAPDGVSEVPEGEDCPEERRKETSEALYGEDFTLYCGFVSSAALTDGRRLILDTPFRYVYETLKLEQNRRGLKKILGPLWPEGILLRHGELTASCDEVYSAPAKISEKRRFSGKSETPSASPFSEEPESTGNEKTEAKEARLPGGVPFDGLVRDVARWMRGEVILVRRGADDDIDDVSAEESKDY